MRCIAIDFETATSKYTSACSLGLVVIEERAIVKRASWLIRPPELYFDPFNTYLHGITAKDVENEPEFSKLWDEIRQYFNNAYLIAHNAQFDMAVLRNMLSAYHIPHPAFQYYCTRTIAKRVWPDFFRHGLATVTKQLGITFQHHKAEEDAYACAEIAMRACNVSGVSNVRELVGKLNIQGKHFCP